MQIVLCSTYFILFRREKARLDAKFGEIVGTKRALFISHRLSSCRFCDRILVFSDKALAQQGSYEKLLWQSGDAMPSFGMPRPSIMSNVSQVGKRNQIIRSRAAGGTRHQGKNGGNDGIIIRKPDRRSAEQKESRFLRFHGKK